MKFFKTRKLVSKQALEVFEKNGVGQDFVLDSDVLSDRGNEFMKYINDFEGTSVGDVQENLQSYWKEFSGRRGG